MRPLALIGPPGSGKTSVGRIIAQRLGLAFVDLDELLVEAHGDLEDLFLDAGNSAVEERALPLLAESLAEDTVIAVSSTIAGGETAGEVLAGCHVVYLASDLARTFGRAGLNAPQPVSLFGTRAVWKALLDEREPGYRGVADAVVQVGDNDLEAVADAVESTLPR